jgi:UDP-glucose 4-epimerase
VRYLITGGAGFIGSHLTDALLAADHDVVVLDDLSTGSMENLAHVLEHPRVRFVEGSVTQADLVDDCVRETDVCLHLASTVGVQLVVDSPLETLLDHVRGTDVVMAAAARRKRRVLFTSTSEVYGKQSRTALTEDADLVIGSPAKSRWSYAIAKCFGEAVAQAYHDQHGTETIVVRLFNTIGARQTGRYGMVLPRFVRQALEGSDLTVYGDGTQTRCFTHVADTVRALAALAECDAAVGNTYNVGSETPVAVGALAERVIARCASASEVVHVAYSEAYAEGFEELGTRTPDTSALHAITGWHAERAIDTAIDDVIAYERGRVEQDLSVNAA